MLGHDKREFTLARGHGISTEERGGEERVGRRRGGEKNENNGGLTNRISSEGRRGESLE